MTRFSDPLVDAFAASGLAAGYKTTPDYNGAQQEGFGVWQMTVRDGRRCSAADAYLRPALARNNLTIEVQALVTRLIFDGKRAAGVEYLQHGETVTAHAEREVILSGGVINSPQLLLLSGIGDPDELRAHEIAVKVALPGVGKNLQDHISASVAYGRKAPGTLHRAMRFDRIVPALANAYWRGEGIATELPTGQMAFLKSRPDAALPDVELIFNAAPMTAEPYFWPFRALRRQLCLPRRGAAPGKPRPGRVDLGRSATTAAHPPEFPGHRQRPQNLARRPTHGARHLPPSADAGVHDAGDRAGRRRDVRRRSRRPYRYEFHHRAPPARHLQNGPRVRSAGGGRSGAARVRHRRPARDRRRGDARPGRRPHQCADHHDRRKSRRPDPRPGSARSGPACRGDGNSRP